MNLKINRTEQNIELVSKLASKNKIEAAEARESLAEFIGPVLQEVINAAPIMAGLFSDMPFGPDDRPAIPLDLYRDVTDTDYLRVWSQAEAGGIPFNQPTPPQNELKFSTYMLDSAITFGRKYAEQSRLDVVAKAFERMMQEVLLKQDRNAAAVILRALASATSSVKNGSAEVPHILRSNNANQLIIDDFVRMFTLHKRIRSAWNDGSPSSRSRGLTDLVVSPEMIEEIRRMSYNPVNTRAGVVTSTGTGVDSSAIPLHEDLRKQIFESAGIPQFYGVNIIEINELGVGYQYNEMFGAFSGGVNIPNHGEGIGSTNTSAFNGTNEEVLIGLDLTSDSVLVRPVVTENNSQFAVESDDQFTRRSGKIGFYGSLEEGRLVLDDRYLSALVV